MAEFTVTVEGRDYDVTAPDEATAWKWANFAAVKGDGAGGKPGTVSPGLSTAASQISPYLPTERGTDIAAELDQVPYNAGAAVNDAAAKVLPAPFAAGLGTAVNFGMNALPMVAGGAVGTAAAPAFRAGSERLMRSALKPGVPMLKGGADARAVETMLDEGLNVSRGGLEKARGLVDDLNGQIDTAIAPSTAIVSKRQVADSLVDTRDKFRRQVNPTSDINAINGVESDFLRHPLLPGDDIPVQLAQELKKGTYKVLKGKYGEQGSAATEAQKALAFRLKEGVANAVPEVTALNAREGALLNTLPALERRVLAEANKNPGGLAFLINNPAASAAFLADKSSLFKSMLARMLNAGQYQIPANAARGAILGNALTQEQGE